MCAACAAADLDKAISIVVDAKVDYPAACNAVEKVRQHIMHVQCACKRHDLLVVKAIVACGTTAGKDKPLAACGYMLTRRQSASSEDIGCTT
jgi:gamma-glutamyl phosphate reductase